MLNFCDFIQVFVFTRNHHLNFRVFEVHRGENSMRNDYESRPKLIIDKPWYGF